MEESETFSYGPYATKELAEAAAHDLRYRDFFSPCPPIGYQIGKVIPPSQYVERYVDTLAQLSVESMEEWLNDNSEGGGEDGFITINNDGLAKEIMVKALTDILKNHSAYEYEGALDVVQYYRFKD